MRNLGIAITAAIVLTSCASADEVASGAQVGEPIPVDELQFVDESPPTTAPATTTADPATTTTTSPDTTTSTAAPETTTTVPETTSAASPAAGSELADDGSISQTDRLRQQAAREHLTAPWFTDLNESIDSIEFIDYPIANFFGSGPAGLPDCPAAEAYALIDQAFTNQRQVTGTDFAQLQTSGYVQADVSAAALIDQVIDSGFCFDEVVAASDEAESATTTRGPTVPGIENSAVMAFTTDGADLQFILATTGDRDIHVLLDVSLAQILEGGRAADGAVTETLEGLAARSSAAAERVDFCTATYQDAAPSTVIDDERCDGFEAHSPELELIGYRHATTSAAVDVPD